VGDEAAHDGDDTDTYDELGLFHENAQELGIPYDGPPDVARVAVDVGGGRRVSALRWGPGPPELVLLHGGAQNAHTWDTVALALRRPLVAIDLPGHGHSDHRDDHAYWPDENAEAMEVAVRAWAPSARLVVGMSLGGLTAIALAARAPDLVRALVLVDVTPGVDREKASSIVQFIDGPDSFASFEEILERTIAFNPTRSESSLRRGVLHNAVRRADGSWTWRYDLPRRGSGDGDDGAVLPGLDRLWDALGSLRAPLTLVRGAVSPVVSDDDVAEVLRRRPDARVVVVDGAGHSVQGDRPLELAAVLSEAAGA
jgi:pimeloyl-ACP methyl ester carboxylesterase